MDGFSPNSKKIHIDIDPSSINKNVEVDLPIIGDVSKILKLINNELAYIKIKKLSFKSKWWNKIGNWKKKNCLSFINSKEIIKPQQALVSLNKKYQIKIFLLLQK